MGYEEKIKKLREDIGVTNKNILLSRNNLDDIEEENQKLY